MARSARATIPVWPLHDAKARFGELFRRARVDGPQRVTRQGKDAVVVLSAERYADLTARRRQPDNFADFLQASPLRGVRLDLRRDRDPGRTVKL